MAAQVAPSICDQTKAIPARSARVGGHYHTLRGRRVIVRRQTTEKVVLWSASTEHLVDVSLDYTLIPIWETLL